MSGPGKYVDRKAGDVPLGWYVFTGSFWAEIDGRKTVDGQTTLRALWPWYTFRGRFGADEVITVREPRGA